MRIANCTGVLGDEPQGCATCRIRSRALFGLVPDERLPVIAALRSRSLRRAAGEAMPEPLFTLFDGWAVSWITTADGYRRVLEIHLPGDLVEQPSAQGGVSALTDVAYCTLAHDRFARLVRTEPDLAMAYMQRLTEARARLWDQLAGPVRQSARARVARLLLDLWQRLQQRGLVREGLVRVPVSQALLAEAAGLSHEQVNRSLRGLQEAGIASLVRGEFQVADIRALAAAAGTAPTMPAPPLCLSSRHSGSDDP